MARLIPSTLTGKTPTLGEERVFAFLKRHLLPHDDHLVWYRPEIPRGKGRPAKPTFVALGPRFALLVLEVRDWLPDSVKRMGKSSVTVAGPGGETQRQPAPGREARDGALSLVELFRRTPGLAHPDGMFAGNLVLPVNAGIITPNLSRADARALSRRAGPDSPFVAERVLTRDEMELEGEPAEKAAQRILARMYVHRFPFRLDEDLVERVRVAIEPQLHFFDFRDDGWEEWVTEEEEVEVEEETGGVLVLEEEDEDEAWDEVEEGEEVDDEGDYAGFERDDEEAVGDEGDSEPVRPGLEIVELPRSAAGSESHGSPLSAEAPPIGVPANAPAVPGFTLDPKQERMARELASPRTLVYGPAGSGKTVFLISRARYWLTEKPDARVLFTCYNSSLASYLHQAFTHRGLVPDNERLTVDHYHDLLSRLLELGDIHDRGAAFYEGLETRVLAEMARRDDLPEYDLILVDEGQDMSRRMIEVLVRLLADGGEITLVCDPAQDIYQRWSTDNLSPMRDFEVEHLVDCYRNTAPIYALARSVLDADVRKEMGLDRLEMTRPEDVGRTGPIPEIRDMGGLDDLVGLISEIAAEFKAEDRPLSQLAVLYTDRHAIPDFPARLRASRWGTAADPRFLDPVGEEDLAALPAGQGTLSPGGDRERESHPEGHWAEALERELMGRGLPAEWVARDFASKAAYDIERERLTLSTIHSAKGMDFHTVLLVGADDLKETSGTAGRRAAALLFTGITRARERFIVPVFGETGWVPGLRERIRDLEEHPVG